MPVKMLSYAYGLAARLVNARVPIAWLIVAGTMIGASASARGDGPITILALGDSLTAGYGLLAGEAFPDQLEAALQARGHDVRIINAGVSGDTTAGGRARFAWSLADDPDAVIVELGANDGLRGLDPEQTFANLDAILTEAAARGVPVLLTGMKAPPNLGREYGAAFDAIYTRLAARHEVRLYPFFLDGVATLAELNQDDGIHPNTAGVAVIVARILPSARALIEDIGREP
jgi:acyl-CoA thioesterase-1